MMLFQESGFLDAARSSTAVLNSFDLQSVDEDVAQRLAMMDPVSRRDVTSVDPVLADFLLWGGLCIAFADGQLSAAETKRLCTVASEPRLEAALAELEDLQGDTEKTLQCCTERFQQCIENRTKRLRSIEVFRILEGLLEIVFADEVKTLEEDAALRRLAATLGVKSDGCDLVMKRFAEERNIAHVSS